MLRGIAARPCPVPASTLMASTASLVASHRFVRFSGKTDDHYERLSRLRRASWTWERHNGPIAPHRGYSFDPTSWNRKAAERMESEAKVGPDLLPLAARIDSTREREREVALNNRGTHRPPFAAERLQQRPSSLPPRRVCLSRFPTVLVSHAASTNGTAGLSDAATASPRQSATATAERTLLGLCGATWDSLRELSQPDAWTMPRREKQQLFVAMQESASWLGAVLVDALARHDAAATEAATEAEVALVADAWLALHFASFAFPDVWDQFAPAIRASALVVSRMAEPYAVAAKPHSGDGDGAGLAWRSRRLPVFTDATRSATDVVNDDATVELASNAFRSNLILATLALRAQAIVHPSVATTPATTTESDDSRGPPLSAASVAAYLADPRNAAFASDDANLDVVAVCLEQVGPRLVAAAASRDGGSSDDATAAAAAALRPLLQLLQFSLARFTRGVVAMHQAFAVATPDKGLGSTPVDGVTLKWVVSSLHAVVASIASDVASPTYDACVLARALAAPLDRIVDSLDQIIHVAPNYQVPVAPLIDLAFAAVTLSDELAAAAATGVEQQVDERAAAGVSKLRDDALGLPALCVAVCARHTAQSLQLLQSENIARLVVVLASDGFRRQFAARAKGAGASERLESARSCLTTRSAFGAVLRAVLCSCAAQASDREADQLLSSAAAASHLTLLCVELDRISAFYPSLRIDIALWRQWAREAVGAPVARSSSPPDSLASGAAAGQQEEDDDSQQRRAVLCNALRNLREFCVDSVTRMQPAPLTEWDAKLMQEMW